MLQGCFNLGRDENFLFFNQKSWSIGVIRLKDMDYKGICGFFIQKEAENDVKWGSLQ